MTDTDIEIVERVVDDFARSEREGAEETAAAWGRIKEQIARGKLAEDAMLALYDSLKYG